MSQLSPTYVHPTALVEDGVRLGEGTKVWDNVHIRGGTSLGEQCIVGEKTHIAYDVQIGNRVKINAMVFICYGVTIEDGVMVSAGTVFTNDAFPRATTPDLLSLRSSDPDEATRRTLVAAGATIGANCTIGSSLTIGRFAMVGMGSVVTHSVANQHLVFGNPARSVGAVCKCGHVLLKWAAGEPAESADGTCEKCRSVYACRAGEIREVSGGASGGSA